MVVRNQSVPAADFNKCCDVDEREAVVREEAHCPAGKLAALRVREGGFPELRNAVIVEGGEGGVMLLWIRWGEDVLRDLLVLGCVVLFVGDGDDLDGCVVSQIDWEIKYIVDCGILRWRGYRYTTTCETFGYDKGE